MGNLFITRTGYPNSVNEPSDNPGYYYSDFPLTEDPISEGGIWLNGNADSGGSHQQMETASGRCFGSALQTGFDDSICLYNGTNPVIGNNHKVTATIYIAGGYSVSSGSHEMILVARGDILGTDNIPYYECLISFNNSFANILHQSGPEGGYTSLSQPALDSIPADGDIFEFQATGSGASLVLSLWQNSVHIVSFTPGASYRHNTGKPGLSAFVTSPNTPSSACWTDVRYDNV